VENIQPQEIKQTIGEIPESLIDTDQDGLKDWEEVLWGTDPSKADSDGDGVGDKEFVSKQQETISARPTTKENSTETSTAQSKPPIKTPVTKAPEVKQPENQLKVYGNTLGVFISAQAQKNSLELQIWNTFFEKKSQTSRDALRNVGLSYGILAQNIQDITSIPEKALVSNTKLSNSYKTLSEIILRIANTEDSAEYETYSKAVVTATNDLIDIIRLFQNNNITFTSKEPGFVFMVNL
jgi:hypothetical protein